LKILLCHPLSSETSPKKSPPLGILFTGAAAENAGYEIEYWVEYSDSQTELEHLIDWADIVGVSSFTGIQLYYAKRIFILAKQKNKITVFGGVHANSSYEQSIKEDYIDYVAVGEGEITLINLVKYLKKEIDYPEGIISKNFPLKRAPVLTEFVSPITNKTLRFFEYSNRTNDIFLPASRGCPYKCGFCINSSKFVGRYRLVPIEVWTQWLNELNLKMNISWLTTGDDYLGNQKRMLTVGKILKEKNINWSPYCRGDNFKHNGEQFAYALKELGVTDISIGIESGNERILKLINKGETLEELEHAAICISNTGIRPQYYFIVGFPTETKEERNQTFDFADRLYNIHKGNVIMSFYNFTPFEGVGLYDLAKEMGMKVPDTMEEWEQFTVSNSGTHEEKNIYHIAGIHFHQQPGAITDLNFPGKRRLLIKLFELLCSLRWKYRFFKLFAVEKFLIEFVIKNLKVKHKNKE